MVVFLLYVYDGPVMNWRTMMGVSNLLTSVGGGWGGGGGLSQTLFIPEMDEA